ncbi:unnamed protein product, partial [Laminaria digitata]
SHVFSSSVLIVTQIRGHQAGSYPPSPLRYAPSFLSRESSALSFLVDSRRIDRDDRPYCSALLFCTERCQVSTLHRAFGSYFYIHTRYIRVQHVSHARRKLALLLVESSRNDLTCR